MSPLFSQTIEWLRFAMAACVVLLHTGSLGAYVSLPVYSTLCIFFSQGICRLAVPFFFFISGFLFFQHLEEWDSIIWKKKIVRRIHSLLIPYLIWNLLAAVLIFSYSYLRAKTGLIEPVSLQETWEGWGGLRIFWDCDKGMPLDYPLWFIRNLIIFVVLSPLIHFMIKHFRFYILVVIALLYFSGILSALEGLLFFMAGAYFSINKMDVLASFVKIKLAAYLLSFLFLVLLVIAYKSNPELYRIFKGGFVITGTIAVINLVSDALRRNRIQVHPRLSDASFFIFASHGILILNDFAPFIVRHILPGDGEWWYCTELFLRAGVAVGLCLLAYYLIHLLSPSLSAILNGGRRPNPSLQ